MGCYSNKVKACCAKYVFAVSVVLFLLGLITAFMGSQMSGMKLPKAEFVNNLNIESNGMGTGVLALGALIVFISCCGCATCKFKKVCFAIPFGLLTGVIGLVLLIIGFLVIGAAGPMAD
jgi:hypothetical protein